MLRKLMVSLAASVSVAALLFTLGCNGSKVETPTVSTATQPKSAEAPPQIAKIQPQAKEEEHPHKPGAHGGIIVAIGRDSYHAEAVFEKNGVLRLFILGQDEGRVQEIENQELTGYVKPAGTSESTVFTFKPQSQAGDSAGKTSQFVANLPAEVSGRPVEVTVPSLRIGTERFRLGFASAVEEHGQDAMPAKVADAEEAKLYLTPGGIYTDADIKANGNVTASQKFKGFIAKHDLKPKSGDKICPVTLTKANPKCAWIIGGKTYEFCCPPCVDEFVAMAKDEETAKEIKEPAAYVKK